MPSSWNPIRRFWGVLTALEAMRPGTQDPGRRGDVKGRQPWPSRVKQEYGVARLVHMMLGMR